MAAIALDNPTSNLQRASRLETQQLADTLLEHYDMDKIDNMTVDRWRPKLATQLPAHVLSILDEVDQQVRTKPSVAKELFDVASWRRVWHQLY